MDTLPQTISLTPTVLGSIAVAVIALILVMWLLMRRGGTELDRRQRALDALDTLTAWQPQATRVLTKPQRIVYSTLYRALPEYMILAQVPLERFVRVPTRHSYSEWLDRVGHLCADFVVCDSASQVIAVIDVRVPDSQASARSRERQARVTRVLKAAGIPFHVWREDAVPSVSMAREVIVRSPGEAPEPLPTTTIPGGLHPDLPKPLPVRHEGPPSDYPEPDEVIELGGPADPPSSTWFDHMDPSPSGNRPARPRRR